MPVNIPDHSYFNTPVSVADVLSARDRRAERQAEILHAHHLPLISFTMNIAGPVKADELIHKAFQEGCSRLNAALKNYPVVASVDTAGIAGFERLICIDAEASELKAVCVALEDADRLGRLFDIDVIDACGRKLSRSSERACLVCGKPGRSCASRRLHTAEELQRVTRQIILDAKL